MDKQTTFAVEVDFAGAGWPVSIIFGMAGSAATSSETQTLYDCYYYCDYYDVTIDIEGKTSEIYGGARKYFDTGSPVEPYLGAGLSVIRAEVSGSVAGYGYSVSDDATSTGLFFDGGVLYRAGSFNIGLGLRLLTGTSGEIFGVSSDANYTQAALVIGYGW